MITKTAHDYYQCLSEIAATMNSVNTSETVLSHIVESIAKTMDVKGCAIMLLTPDGMLVHAAAYGLSDWYLNKGPILARMSIPEALDEETIAVFDATTDERIQYRRLAKKEGIASILSAPIRLREECIGVMRMYSAEPRHFSDEDIAFASTAVSMGAIALENAVVYHLTAHDQANVRQKMLEWRTSLGNRRSRPYQ